MPKVNVYLPDRLSTAVRMYDIPLSAICQRALEAEVAARMSVMTLTPRSRAVLAVSAREAEALGHDFVGTEHLLLGLIVEGKGLAAQILDDLGVTDSVRQRLLETLTSPNYPRRTPTPSVDTDGNLVGEPVTIDDGATTLTLESSASKPEGKRRPGKKR